MLRLILKLKLDTCIEKELRISVFLWTEKRSASEMFADGQIYLWRSQRAVETICLLILTIMIGATFSYLYFCERALLQIFFLMVKIFPTELYVLGKKYVKINMIHKKFQINEMSLSYQENN